MGSLSFFTLNRRTKMENIDKDNTPFPEYLKEVKKGFDKEGYDSPPIADEQIRECYDLGGTTEQCGVFAWEVAALKHDWDDIMFLLEDWPG